jgi:nucleotide-binding universal stress UspA family protein
MVLVETLNAIEQRGRERTRRARAAMAEFCKKEDIVYADAPPVSGVSASWRERVGDDLDELISQARFHDVAVLARGADPAEGLSPAELGEIVIHSGRPVVLAPKSAPSSALKTIAIAWKDAPEAARAITASMPLLAKAQRIEILSASEGDSKATQCVDCSDRIVKQLRWHGLNAHGHFVVPGGRAIPDAVIESAIERGADLLVMGAYGHSRLRESVFGGFTRRILRGSELPVFLFH